MKLWFESTNNYLRDEEHVQFGCISYRHKRKEWKGFTIHLFFLDRGISLNYVSNFVEYQRVMNYRHSFGVRKVRK